MSYEKEIAYLRKEFKKSEDKFREAEREGYETDADIWQDDMVNIGHQIHIHEQAAKADEYEAKAKALDGVKELINAHDCAIEEESGLGHLFLLDLKAIIKYAESGDRSC